MRKLLLVTAISALSAIPVLAQDAGEAEEVPNSGSSIYEIRCAACHRGSTNDRIPSEDQLRTRSPEQVQAALTSGAMVAQAQGLTDEEIRLLATFVTGKAFGGEAVASAGACPGNPPPFNPNLTTDWNGWSIDTQNTRFQPNPGLSAADIPNLELKWAYGFPDATRAVSQVTLAGGRVFVGSHGGNFYSLDAETGCSYWVYPVGDIARTANVVAQDDDGRWVVYFGDSSGYLHAVDVMTGEAVWKRELDDHALARITGAPVWHDGRIYVGVSSGEELGSNTPGYECCTFRGSLLALDAATGEVVWKTYTIPDPPTVFKTVEGRDIRGPAGSAIWSSPAIDEQRGAVYAVTGNSYTEVDVPTSDAIVAFDLETGSMLWSTQVTPGDNWLPGCPRSVLCPENAGEDVDLAASAVLIHTEDRDLILAGQKSGMLYALDPDNMGEIVWERRLGGGGAFMGGIMWGLATDQDVAYVGVGDPSGPEAAPGFYAVRTSDGELLWSHRVPEDMGRPEQPTAATLIPGIVFSATFGGQLLAHDAETGEIVWSYNTLRPFDTVNGVEATGGAFDGGGPAVANGMVVVGSGMGFAGGAAGNVLLAFGLPE